jgi:hypothetical protein
VSTIISHGTRDICARVRHDRDNKSKRYEQKCSRLKGANETAVHAKYVEMNEDLFQLHTYYNHYVKPRVARNYRMVSIKFEALWTDKEFPEIAQALCLPRGTTSVLWPDPPCCHKVVSSRNRDGQSEEEEGGGGGRLRNGFCSV